MEYIRPKDVIRRYTGILSEDKYTDNPQKKYERAHEKRRLKAYLKGKKYFFHGREVLENMMFTGFPKRFLVDEIKK